MTVPAADRLRFAAKWHGYSTIMQEAGAAADLLDAIEAALPDPWADEPVTYDDAVVALTTIFDLLHRGVP